MVTDAQVRKLMERVQAEDTLSVAAAKAGMDEKTARKYRRASRLPSQMRAEHRWRTREDPFEEVWPVVRGFLEFNAGLQAKTLFGYLQREEPGRFADGQLRTLQRQVKVWRALEGPAQDVFFAQVHEPGELAQADFTDMNKLAVTIRRQPFDHMVMHVVLTYSNWETASTCFSESFEALSAGTQDALWELGGVPKGYQTDSLSAAVHKLEHPEVFTSRYGALMRHYDMAPRRTNPVSPHENGDVEQRHYRFFQAVDQALMLRGSRDFDSREAYELFRRQVQDQLNAGRRARLAEELKVLGRLPARRMEDYTRHEVVVSRFSTIRVADNTYSVHSRLRDERVQVRLNADHLDVYYAQRHLERIPRLRGRGGHRIQYRHVIDALVRKPGAFAGYRYRDDLFPTTCFRVAYDALCEDHAESVASRQYLKILHLAAHETPEGVEAVLQRLLGNGEPVGADRVEELLAARAGPNQASSKTGVTVVEVDLSLYDDLLPSTRATRAEVLA
jgi:hypothetical protein